jgi:hypothetical protein
VASSSKPLYRVPTTVLSYGTGWRVPVGSGDFDELIVRQRATWGILSRRSVNTRTSGHARIVGETMLRTILITGSIGMIVGFAGTLLTLFGGGSIRVEYVEFAVALLLFLVMLIGAYWFVISEHGIRKGKKPKK